MSTGRRGGGRKEGSKRAVSGKSDWLEERWRRGERQRRIGRDGASSFADFNLNWSLMRSEALGLCRRSPIVLLHQLSLLRYRNR